MIEQVGTAIVMFLVGAACTFFLGKATGFFGRLDNVEFGIQALLRDRILQMYNYYNRKERPIPQQEIDSCEQMFTAYKRLGGNGYIDHIEHEIVEEMPHEPR